MINWCQTWFIFSVLISLISVFDINMLVFTQKISHQILVQFICDYRHVSGHSTCFYQWEGKVPVSLVPFEIIKKEALQIKNNKIVIQENMFVLLKEHWFFILAQMGYYNLNFALENGLKVFALISVLFRSFVLSIHSNVVRRIHSRGKCQDINIRLSSPTPIISRPLC